MYCWLRRPCAPGRCLEDRADQGHHRVDGNSRPRIDYDVHGGVEAGTLQTCRSEGGWHCCASGIPRNASHFPFVGGVAAATDRCPLRGRTHRSQGTEAAHIMAPREDVVLRNSDVCHGRTHSSNAL